MQKKRALNDIQRSGGLYGQDSLAELKKREEGSLSEEEEIEFLQQIFKCSQEAKNANLELKPDLSDIQSSIVNDKKRKLLEQFS